MFNFIKRLFKRGERVTVCKYGKVYKFISFEKAVAFMLLS